MIVYIDSIFFINLFMSFFITIIVGKLVNGKYGIVVSFARYFCGSFVTSLVYLFTILIPFLRINFNFMFTVLMLCINVYITFKPTNIKMFFTYFFSIHLVAFAVGGMCFGLFYYTKFGSVLGNSISYTLNNISLKLLLASIGGSYIFAKVIGEYLEYLKISKQKIISTKIIKEKEIDIPMLVDTGNTLVDVVSQLPVVIVYYEDLEKILHKDLYSLYLNKQDVISYAFQIEHIAPTLKLIPFKSIGRESGLILGFESDIEFIIENKNYFKRCVVGISDFKINNSGEYLGIFNPTLIKEETVNVERSMA